MGSCYQFMKLWEQASSLPAWYEGRQNKDYQGLLQDLWKLTYSKVGSQTGIMFSTRQTFKGNAAISQFAYISLFNYGHNVKVDMEGWV